MKRSNICILQRHASGDLALRLGLETIFPSSICRFCLLLLCAVGLASAAPTSDTYSVRDFGAQGDGKTDDTAAFQKALDAARQAGGGVVYAPRGNYFFAGHLNVPSAVTLKGMWESVPSHVGLRNAGAAKPTDDGTTFFVTARSE